MEELIDKILKDVNFFDVFIGGYALRSMVICTYRPPEVAKSLFEQAAKTAGGMLYFDRLSLKEIKSSKEYFPIFSVELHNEYKDLETLAEDLMVSRLSGVIDRDMEGMPQKEEVYDEQTDEHSDIELE